MIDIQNLKKSFKQGKLEVQILKGINIHIDKGEYVSLMGPSGSGKSTFLNIIGCLDIPSSGKYFLNGKEVSKLSDNELSELRNKEIGYVFQAYNLLPKLNAIENVELPAVYKGIGRKERRQLAKKALESVGLGDRLYHKPNELSGGQKQRVAIARALINNPNIIFADEPTGNLDSKSGEEVLQIFKKLNDAGVTILMVTHEEEVALHTKRIIRLKDGIIISDSKVEQEVENEHN